MSHSQEMYQHEVAKTCVQRQLKVVQIRRKYFAKFHFSVWMQIFIIIIIIFKGFFVAVGICKF